MIVVSKEHKISKQSVLLPPWSIPYIDYVLITEGEINDRVAKMAYDQLEHYYKMQELTIVAILNGATQFALSFTNQLQNYIATSYSLLKIKYKFIKISTYINDKSAKEPTINITDIQDCANANVLVLEDILETGKSLKFVKDSISKVCPSSLRSGCLFAKESSNTSLTDFIGFQVPNVFLVGYFTDFNEYFRDIKPAVVLNKEGVEKFKITN